MRAALLLTLAGLLASCATNRPAEIRGEVGELSLLPSARRSVALQVSDPDGDPVTLTVSTLAGFAIVTEAGIDYTAPEGVDSDVITLQAHDGAEATLLDIPVEVQDPLGFAPMWVAETPGNSKSPSLALTADGTVHVAWHDFSEDPSALHHATLTGGVWTEALLDLSEHKLTRPRLLADGDVLHLLADRYIDGDYTVLHATWEAGVWSEAEEVAPGRRASPALGPDGALHIVWYGEDAVSHAWWDGAWQLGGPIGVTAPYVYTIRLALVGTPWGLQLALPLSPGETSYDMNLFDWDPDTGWAPAWILYESPHLGCEEPAGALGPDGVPRWVWAEQDEVELWTFGIAEMTEEDPGISWVTQEEGFSADPGIAVPPDGASIVAWTNEAGEFKVARAPYDAAVVLAEAGRGPRLVVDPDGYTHVTWFAFADGVEQIGYATNRP